MPKRMNTVRYDSAAVQGEDSYVELRLFTWGEMKEMGLVEPDFGDDEDAGENGEDRKAKAERKRAQTEKIVVMTEDMFVDAIVGWNWVDENGKPLPLPSQDRSVIEGLTSLETEFIVKRVMGSEVEVKKKQKR